MGTVVVGLKQFLDSITSYFKLENLTYTIIAYDTFKLKIGHYVKVTFKLEPMSVHILIKTSHI